MLVYQKRQLGVWLVHRQGMIHLATRLRATASQQLQCLDRYLSLTRDIHDGF